MEIEHDQEVNETPTPVEPEAQEPVIKTDDNVNIDADPEPAKPESDPEAEDAGADEQTEKPPAEDKTPAWARKRFDELTFRYNEEKRQREALEQRLMEQKQNETPLPKFDKPKPTLEEFDYDDASYLEALTGWKIEQREHERQARSKIQADTESQHIQTKTFNEKRTLTMERGIGKYDDFTQVISAMPGDIMNETVAAALVETPNSEDVAYFLGKNITEAQKISKMDPIQVAIEIGAISAKLRIKPTKLTSSAPEPVKPLNASRGGVQKDPSQMTDAEYSKWRRERIKSRR